MSNSEVEDKLEIELKDMDTVITEKINKVADEVSNTIEDLFEKSTVAVNSVKVVENLGLEMILESSLSKDQKKLASNIYDSVKPTIQGFISDPNVNNAIKITKTLSQLIKQLENTKIDGKVLSGADKKVVAIELGRILIKELVPDDKGEDEVLIVYDLIAETTLEAMIEVSKVVNVVVQEMATKCCPGLLELFKRVKKTA